MRLLLPIALLFLGLGAGIAAGMMAGRTDATSGQEDGATDSATGETRDTAGGAGADATDAGVGPSTGGTEYVRLRNQFIVPVVRGGSVRSLVIMSLTVEVTLGSNETVFEHEPRLRDSFLRVLFAHANAGGFDDVFTDAHALDPLRQGLRDAAVAVLGTVVHDVLVVDITRQDS
jgi:hypothetical protein